MSAQARRRSLEPPEATGTRSPQRQRTDSITNTPMGNSGSSSTYTWYRRALKVVRQHVSRPVDLRKEYGKVIELDCDIDHPCDVAESGAAEGRNRYCDVLPYDYNRVILQQDKAHYINASTVQYSHPSLPHICSYIAAQGPLPRTAADFWAMVLEQQVPVVLMLTNCNEAGVVKCSQYFPNTLHSVSKAGSYEVKVEQQESFGADCTLREMQLSCTTTGATHSFSHYHYHSWPDHGVPKTSSSIRTLCRALDPVRASGRPVIVHCSAGIGRTGTLCAIDILMQRLDAWATANGGSGPQQSDYDDTLDVPKLVHQLRAQRMGMVQTPDQYLFVYKALLDDLAERVRGSSLPAGGSTSAGSSGDGSSIPLSPAAADVT